MRSSISTTHIRSSHHGPSSHIISTSPRVISTPHISRTTASGSTSHITHVSVKP